MPGKVVAAKIEFGDIFTSWLVSIIFKLLTENCIVRLPLSLFLRNTLDERVGTNENNHSVMILKQHKGYELMRINTVSHCYLEVLITLAMSHPTLASVMVTIRLVQMDTVIVEYKTVINMLMYGTHFT